MRILDTEVRIDAEVSYSVTGRGADCEIDAPSVRIRVRASDLAEAYKRMLVLKAEPSDFVPVEVSAGLTRTEYDGIRGDCAVDASLCAEADPERADD